MMIQEEDFLLIDAPCSDEQVLRWQELSALTSFHGYRGEIELIRSEIEKSAQNTKEGAFRQLYWYWIGAYQAFTGDLESGLTSLNHALDCGRGEGSICKVHSIDIAIGKQLAQLHISAGDLDKAHMQITRLDQFHEDFQNEFYFDVAQEFEGAGYVDQALEFYRKASSKAIEPGEVTKEQMAVRHAAFLTEQNTSTSLDQLVERIFKAIGASDRRLLSSLATESLFRVGFGAHFHYPNFKAFMGFVETDAKSSTVRFDEVARIGTTATLKTHGWRGEILNREVSLGFSLVREGWYWTSLTLGANQQAYVSTLEEPEQESNQPLPFTLFAPWDRGIRTSSKAFMAGGIRDPLESPVAIPAPTPSIWDIFFPGIKKIIDAVDEPASLLPDGVRRAALAARPCGHGVRGLYYHTPLTHLASNAFAIDFTSYEQFSDASNFSNVLAAVGGRVVGPSTHRFPNSGSSTNLVEILTSPSVRSLFGSRYLHLANEPIPPVAVGMSVPAGAFIGRMQETGNASIPHLHFSMHNQLRPGTDGRSFNFRPRGRGVRPFPMEGVALEDGDESSCILSSQGGTPSIRTTPSVLTALRGEVLTLSSSISGGASPFRVSWRSNIEARTLFTTRICQNAPRLPSSRTTLCSSRGRFLEVGRHIITTTVTDTLGRVGRHRLVFDVGLQSGNIAVVNPVQNEVFGQNERIVCSAVSTDPSRRAAVNSIEQPYRDREISWHLDWVGAREGPSSRIAIGHSHSIPANSLSVGRHRLRARVNNGDETLFEDRNIVISDAVTHPRPTVEIALPDTNVEVAARERRPGVGPAFFTAGYFGEVRYADGSFAGSDVSRQWTITDNNGRVDVVGNSSILVHGFELRDGIDGTTYKVTFSATNRHEGTAETHRFIVVQASV